MSEQRLTPNTTTPTIRVIAIRNDAPVTITATEPGLLIAFRQASQGRSVSQVYTPIEPSNLASVVTAHTAGGLIVLNAKTGEHRLDLPAAAAVNTPADAIDLRLEATDPNLLMFPAGPVVLANPRGVVNILTQAALEQFVSTDTGVAIGSEHAQSVAKHSQGSGGGSGGGPGSRELTWVIQESGTPKAGIECWISTDSAGSNIVAGTFITDDSGTAVLPGTSPPIKPQLDDDVVYYGWRDSSEYNPGTNPIQFRYSTANARWEIWNGSAYVEWTP